MATTATQNYLRDRASKLLILVIIALVIQVIYTTFVRPRAEEWLAEQREIARTTPGYTPARSLVVIIQDPEQQMTISVSIWAVILTVMRFRELKQQRELLNAGLVKLAPGVVILPSDAREYMRTF